MLFVHKLGKLKNFPREGVGGGRGTGRDILQRNPAAQGLNAVGNERGQPRFASSRCWVPLGSSLNLSGPHVPHLLDEDKSTCPREWYEELKTLTCEGLSSTLCPVSTQSMTVLQLVTCRKHLPPLCLDQGWRLNLKSGDWMRKPSHGLGRAWVGVERPSQASGDLG